MSTPAAGTPAATGTTTETTAETAASEKTETSKPEAVLAMDDEAFMKLNQPDEVEVHDKTSPKEEAASTTKPAAKPAPKSDNVADDKTGKDNKPVTAKTSTTKPTPSGTTGTAEEESEESGDEDGTGTATTAAEAGTSNVDYEQFYKKIMAPFKANGKTIELKSPEEAIQLMQMGANYTRKMQDIQPHRKTLMMLESNGLLDPDKLSYLIDLDKKNPDAIKKLIKDSGINPMEIDTEAASTYLGGNHKVSDEEANFRSHLDELSSNPDGKVTLQTIHSTWDQASKDALWREPQVMAIIHTQRENGIYGRITAEMDRRRTLGQIPVGTPFLQAYKTVGDELAAKNGFADLVPVTPTPPREETPAGEIVATRAATPKPTVTNGDQANAAAATRTNGKKAEKFVNPLAMSDDDFLKQMNNRV